MTLVALSGPPETPTSNSQNAPHDSPVKGENFLNACKKIRASQIPKGLNPEEKKHSVLLEKCNLA